MIKKVGKEKERSLFLIYNYDFYCQDFFKMMKEALKINHL